MMLKKMMTTSVFTALLLLSACGNTESEDSAKPEKQINKVANTEIEKEKEKEKEVEEKVEESVEEIDDTTVSTDGILNPYIAEATGGDVEIVFSNTKPDLKQHIFGDGVSIQIDEYQIVHVTNMNESKKYEFQDQDEGYVLTYKMTLDNQLNEDIFFNASSMLLSDDATENLYMKAHFVERDSWMKDESNDVVRQYSKGGSFTGMQAYAMTKEQFERIKAPTLTISQPFLNDDTSKTIGKEAVFKLPFSGVGAKKATIAPEFYADKMVTDNIADKELLFSKEDINEEKEIDNVKVVLNGVQYAKITPTTAHAPRFSNFGEGPLVALTAKFTVKNDSDLSFSKFLIEKKLILDQNRGTIRSEGMLEPIVSGDIKPGDSDEVLAVFIFREDEFNLLKELDLQFGPLKDEKAKMLFKEKSATFKLPMK